MKINNSAPENKTINDKIHPWRLCPAGEHWVSTHIMRTPPSKEHPEGLETIRHSHCARNPSGKDMLYPGEIREISEQSFANASPKPCNLKLDFGEVGNKFDDLIAGWTKYWNDIFSPSTPLDPNFVKALIATESRFIKDILANKKDPKSGQGLTQILNKTRKILKDEKGELKNHFVSASLQDLNDPSINICAGIRWLFHKRKLASSKLRREVSWEEAIYEFKGGSTVSKERANELYRVS